MEITPCFKDKEKIMEKIKVKVDWCDKNFGAVTEDDVLCGMVVATSKSYESLMIELSEAVREHVEGLLQDGETLPEWLVNGDYEFDVELGVAALLRKCEQFPSFASISRVSCLTPPHLSPSARGLRVPRIEQRRRIVDGSHRIGTEFVAVV